MVEASGYQDEFIHLEDLESEEARRFIDHMNSELRQFLGSLPERYRGLFMKLLSQPRVTDLAAVEDGLYLLYKGSRDLVAFAGWDGGFRRLVRVAGGDDVIAYIERVMGSNYAAIHVSPAGADEGYVDIVGSDGRQLARVRGSAWSFALVGGELYYARFYRRTPPPDGGKPPAYRVARLAGDGEEVVWGSSLEAGMRLGVRYLPEAGLFVYTVWRGWSRSWLYIAYSDEPSKASLIAGGDAAYTPVGWAGGLIVLRRGEEGDRLLVYEEDTGRLRELAEIGPAGRVCGGCRRLCRGCSG